MSFITPVLGRVRDRCGFSHGPVSCKSSRKTIRYERTNRFLFRVFATIHPYGLYKMTTKYNIEALGWQKKSGPAKVWRVIEAVNKTRDGRTLCFSIQEIPDDRHDDVLEHMSNVFLRDEPLFSSAGVFEDPDGLADMKKLWRFALQQGIVVGAFLVDENNPKPLLAGTNMILVNCAATERGMKREIVANSEPVRRILKFMAALEDDVNIYKRYNVDKYITAFGLCVARNYRKMGLGYHLLKARDDISLAYDIPATSTVFSGPAAQKAAARSGFEILIERKFVDVKNDDGSEMFPTITAERFWLMGKSFLQQK